jgi:hypothetical protein
MDNNKYKAISALVAFSLYFLFLFFLFYIIENNHIKKIDAFKKPTVLQLDIIIDTPKDIPKKVLINKNNKISKNNLKVIKKSASTSVKKRTNLKSLFAKVKTNVKKVSKKRVSTVKKSSISSRFKSKFEKEKKVQNLKLSKLIQNKKIAQNKNIATETKNADDPYFSNIYKILSLRWKPTIFYNNLNAKVLVSISSNGIFSYQFVQYSNNIGFDKQLKDFLENESLKKYPISPEKKSIQIEILFQSKG